MSYGMQILNNTGKEVVNTSDKAFVFHSKGVVSLKEHPASGRYGAPLPNIPGAIFFYKSSQPIVEDPGYKWGLESPPGDVYSSYAISVTWYAFVPLTTQPLTFGMVLYNNLEQQTFNTEKRLLKILGIYTPSQDPVTTATGGSYVAGYSPSPFSEQTPFSGNIAFSTSLSRFYGLTYRTHGGPYVGTLYFTGISRRAVTVSNSGLFTSNGITAGFFPGRDRPIPPQDGLPLSSVIIDVTGL